MNRIYVLFLSCFLFSIFGCSGDDDNSPAGPQLYSITGQVNNQDGDPALDLTVVRSVNGEVKDSVVTDAAGIYTFPAITGGATTLIFRSEEIIVSNFPRYLDSDTLVNITSNSVMNFSVKEFNTMFHDNGSGASVWNGTGGISNDGSKYIFEDLLFQSDYMEMSSPIPVPLSAGIVYLALRGQSAPSDSGLIAITFFKNGIDTGWIVLPVFNAQSDYFLFNLTGLPLIAGDTISLKLEFLTSFNSVNYPATYVYIDDIWIFNY